MIKNASPVFRVSGITSPKRSSRRMGSLPGLPFSSGATEVGVPKEVTRSDFGSLGGIKNDLILEP